MNNFRYLIIVFVGMLCLLGCENEVNQPVSVPIPQTIKVTKHTDTQNYEDFKEIIAQDQVTKVQDILDDIKWENAKVDMERRADYRFMVNYSNSSFSLYELWVSPNHDKVELVFDGKYAQLDKEPSAILFETLTGTELSEF